MSARHATDPALTRALDLSGGASALARALGITPQAVGQWRRTPTERVLQLERISGVPRTELRPDLYPPAADPASDVDRSCVRPSEAAPSEPCEAAE
ncbi:transcriptional regulator [Mongoliimonas terrestris]|uniref:transcriptional regulator n=1 Tax=Mongoliimonas terrestris TaxID=1709001 RepID=UPI00094994F3|nr:Cro/CI family transcriptional regulator [Mongoliimonas terrestris]